MCGERRPSPPRSVRRKRRCGDAALRLRRFRDCCGELGRRRCAAADPTAERGVEDHRTRRVDGKQRENRCDRRHDRDTGHDAAGARLLQSAVAETPVTACKSVFGKLLMMFFLVIGEEKRNRLVMWRQLVRLHVRALERHRIRLLVPGLLVGCRRIAAAARRAAACIAAVPQLLVPGLIGSYNLGSLMASSNRSNGSVGSVGLYSRPWRYSPLLPRDHGRPCTYYLLSF